MTAMSGMVFMTDVSSMFTVLVVLAVNAAMTFVCVFRQLLRVIHVCIHSAKLYPPGYQSSIAQGGKPPEGNDLDTAIPWTPKPIPPMGIIASCRRTAPYRARGIRLVYGSLGDRSSSPSRSC